MSLQTEIDRAREALGYIPNDLPRPEWHKHGRAAIAAGLSVDDVLEWSRGANNFRSDADVRAAFKTITPEGGTGPGTLFQTAKRYGWRDSDKTQTPARQHSPAGLGQTAEPTKPKAPAPAPRNSPAEVWARCQPATWAHPYIVRKAAAGVPLEQLRVLPANDRLRIGGRAMAGALVVPGYAPDGALQTLQLIPPEGPKMNLAGAPMAGALHIVGTGDGPLYLCEGIGAAWACWQATGHRAVAVFGWGNVARVAAQLRQREQTARLVLVPDAGKEGEATAIAREHGCAVAAMPEGWPANSDVGDLAQRDGREALAQLLEAAQAPAPLQPRYRLLSSADLRDLPPLTWRVRGVLPAEGLAALYGPSASGKSFLAFDMAAAIAEGRDWFGHRTQRAPVVYVALEGEAGFRQRVAAWELAHDRDLPAGLHLVLQPFKLTEPGDVADLAAVVPAGAVLILDTLNRAAPLADENASRDMGEILEAAKRMQAMTAGLVVLVHHTGKDTTRGLRGHSSLFAAMDAAVEVSRDGDRRDWKLAKAKDGDDGRAHTFRLAVQELGADADGEPITSCTVEPDTAAQDVRAVKLPQGGNQRVVLDALRPLFQKNGRDGIEGAPPLRLCLELEAAIAAGAAALAVAPDRKTERARQAITGLIARGVLVCRDGWVWQS